jgi:hypothetical protein
VAVFEGLGRLMDSADDHLYPRLGNDIETGDLDNQLKTGLEVGWQLETH